MGRRLQSILFFTSFFYAVVALTQTSPQGTSLQGRILDSSNNPLEDASVLFTVQVVSPGVEECVLYEETHTVNMTGSGGVFALALGSGTRTGAAFEDTSTLAQVFNNASGQINALTCASGSSYTPSNTAKRKIKMTFDNGGGPQTVTQTLDIQSVPYALYADTLQGRAPADFLQTSAMTTQVKIDNLATTANYNELLALIGGTSANYTLANGGNFTPAADMDFNGKKIVDLAAPTAATDAVNKNYSDTKFGGANFDQTGLADGQSVRWNQALTKWEVYTPTTSQWVTSGSNIYYNTGDVGIGTNSPGAKLHVTGDAIFRGNSNAITLQTTSPTTYGYVTLQGAGVNGVGLLADPQGGNAFLLGSSNSGVVVNSAGNTGIKTSAPLAPLDVYGGAGTTTTSSNINGQGTAGVANITVGSTTGFPTSGVMLIDSEAMTYSVVNATTIDIIARAQLGTTAATHANGATVSFVEQMVSKGATSTPHFVATSSGNVGVGTATPTANLEVTGTVGSVSTTINGGSLRLTGGDSNGFQMTIAGNRVIAFETGTTGTIRSDSGLNLSSSGVATMHLDSSNNVGIGTTSPTTGTRLDITGTGAAASSIIIPRDTVANRPTVGVNGMMRYASDTNKFEAYENGAWVNMIGGGGATSVTAGNGTVGAPSISFSGDPNTGLYSNGADIIGIATNGANVFNISSTTLSSPTTGGALITSGNGTAAAPTFSFAGDPDTGWFRPSADTLAASTGGVERMRIDSSGRVGIGVTNPTRDFEMAYGSGHYFINQLYLEHLYPDGFNTTSPMHYIKNNDVTNGQGQGLWIWAGNGTNDYPLKVESNNGAANLLSVRGDGRVGVGTASPLGKLDVSSGQLLVPAGTIAAPAIAYRSDTNTGIFFSADTVEMSIDGASRFRLQNLFLEVPNMVRFGGDASVGYQLLGADEFSIFTADTNRLFVGATGNVGIANAAPAAKLDVSGDIKFGNSNAICDVLTEGSQRYNFVSDKMEFCDGSVWAAISSGAGATTVDGLTDAYTDYVTTHNLIFGRTGAAALTAGAASNLFIGESAGSTSAASTSTTDNNTAVGYQSLTALTSGSGNSALGIQTLSGVTTGVGNVGIGVGAGAGISTTSENIAIGSWTLYNAPIGGSNIGIGYGALKKTQGNHNIAIGEEALTNLDVAGNNDNVAVGYNALLSATTGTNNTAIGALAGDSLTTGSGNILIGRNADTPAVNTSNFLNIGNTIYGDLSTGRVGIGTTTPGSPLEVVGNITASAWVTGGAVQINNQGNATTPSIHLTGSGTAGLFTPAADTMAFATNASERMRISSTGNVVIGATSPTTGTRLDITGTGAAASSIIIPRDTVANRPTVGVNGMMRYATDTNKFEAFQNGTWIDMIGTASGVSAGAGTDAAPSITFSGDSNTGFYSSGVDSIGITTNGSQTFNITSNYLSGAAAGGAMVKSGASSVGAPTFSFVGDSDTGWWHPAANTMAASTDGTERMRIDASGYVGIGGTPNGAAKLDVLGAGRFGDNMTTLSSNADLQVLKTSNPYMTIDDNYDGVLSLGKTATTSQIAVSSGDLQFKTGVTWDAHPSTTGTTRMTILSTGEVGIGTTGPVSKLDVVTPSHLGMRLETTAGASELWFNIYLANSTAPFRLITNGPTNTNPISFDPGGNEAMRITPAGNVGIGTATPQGLLHLSKTSGGDPALAFTRSDGKQAEIRYNPGATALDFRVGGLGGADTGSTAMVIMDGGNMGVGDSNPDARLEVNGTFMVSATSAGDGDRFIVNSSGNVGIGTTAPGSKLDVLSADGVNSTAAIVTMTNNDVTGGQGQGLLIKAGNNSSLDYPLKVQTRAGVDVLTARGDGAVDLYHGNLRTPGTFDLDIDNDNDSTNAFFRITKDNAATELFRVEENGDVNIAAGALRFGGTSVCTSAGCTAVSDVRLKENIQPLENSLEKILQLQGVEYDYKDKAKFGDKHQIGVIAQETEKIFPEVVITDKKSGFKAVAYDHLVAPLIEAVKTLYNRIVDVEGQQDIQARQIASKADKSETEALKAENAQLKAKNQELEHRLEKIEKALNSK